MSDDADKAQKVQDLALKIALDKHKKQTKELGAGSVSRSDCVDCGDPIEAERIRAVEGVQRCGFCQDCYEKERRR